MISEPRVSVIVPNYNHGRFLRQRLDSVFDQTYQDFELIYLDDASTDDSAAVFEDYRNRPKVSAFYNASNGGSPFPQWNRGVQEAKGKFVWIAESDDYAEPDLLRTLVEALEAHPGCGVAYCRSKIVNEGGADTGVLDRPDGPRWDKDFIHVGSEELKQVLCRSNTIPNASAVVFRKDLFYRVGRVPHDMRYAGDWMLWCRMLAVSDLYYSATPLNLFRQHSATQRSSAKKSGLWVQEGYQVLLHLLSSGIERGPAFEAGLDDMVRKWLESTALPGGRISLDTHRTIYRIAQRVDPHIGRRILKKIPRMPSVSSLRLLRGIITANRKR